METIRETEQKPAISANLFAMLALRQYRLDQVVYRRAGLATPRLSRQVELYLTCYRVYKLRELQALPSPEQMQAVGAQIRQVVAAMTEAAQASSDPAVVAATLAKVEELSAYMKTLSEQLEEVASG